MRSRRGRSVSAPRCCDSVASRARGLTAKHANRDGARPAFVRRCVEIAEWAMPGAALALLPKCPGCVAAYVAIWTGIGISAPTATYVRIGLVVLCVASLSYLAARQARRLIRWTLDRKEIMR